MDPVTLIVAAVAAGAGAGLTDAASSTVRDAYQGLTEPAAPPVRRQPTGGDRLAQAEQDPQTWEAPLRKYVADSGADRDGTVLEAAQRLMALLDTAGSQAGKYQIDARYAQGAQFGDHNVQTITFTGPTR